MTQSLFETPQKPLELRYYQKSAVAFTWEWMRNNPGNLCIKSPGGTGKSIIIAQLCKEAIKNWPGTRILMLTGQEELLRQNQDKMRNLWQNAPLGMYSAALGRKDIDAITFAGIGSIFRKSELLGKVDFAIVDECDLISHHDEGMYRQLINELTIINPDFRVVGLTATEFRMNHGLITDKPAIFDEIYEAISIEKAVEEGFLAPLRSKPTKEELSVRGVHLRNGDYIPGELQKATDIPEKTLAIVKEVLDGSEGRLHWLTFCTGVDHALHVRDAFRALGVSCETVTGQTPKAERKQIIDDFMAGKTTCLTNAFVLSRGFDYPDIDLVVDLAPTKSPSRYIQKVVRGMRLKSHCKDCKVMDFSGNIREHGPIINVRVPGKYIPGDGVPPSKVCQNPECGEICAASARFCIACGFEFPKSEVKLERQADDIMGREPSEMNVKTWTWTVQKSRKTELPMIVVTYYGGLASSSLKEYLCLWHDGFAAQKAQGRLRELAKGCNVPWEELQGDDATERMERAYPPARVFFKMEGKYQRIVGQEWSAMAESEEQAPF